MPSPLDVVREEIRRRKVLRPHEDTLLALVQAESGGDPWVIAAANMPAAVVSALRKAGYRVVEYNGPQWGRGISVGLFQINALAPPAAAAAELDRIGKQVYGDNWRPVADLNDWDSIIQRVAILSEPDYNARIALAHIEGRLKQGAPLSDALRPWEAAPKVLGSGAGAQAAAPQDASTVAGLSTEDLAQLQAEQLEAMADMLRRLGFSEEEIRLFLRSQVGLPATSAQDMLKTGISWLDALAQARREALGQAFSAQSDATKLLVTLLGRAVPEGGTIPGLEPGGSVDYFSRLAGLSPMPQPQTRQVDLGPLFSLARQMRPEEDLYFSALAQTAARLGMDLPTLWERALQEAGAIEDENTRQEVTTALQDWRQRVIQNAATPEEAFAALGWAM